MKNLTKEEVKERLLPQKDTDWNVAEFSGHSRYNFPAVYIFSHKYQSNEPLRIVFNKACDFRKYEDEYITYLENKNNPNLLGFKIAINKSALHAKICWHSVKKSGNWASVNCKVAFCERLLKNKNRKCFELHKKGEIYFIKLNEELN